MLTLADFNSRHPVTIWSRFSLSAPVFSAPPPLAHGRSPQDDIFIHHKFNQLRADSDERFDWRIGRRSNRAPSQAFIGFHGVLFFNIEFMMVNNFLMQATMMTLGGFPAFLRRSANALIVSLQRIAETAAIYKTARISARPPQMKRLPRCLPLSLASGATPVKAAISRRFNLSKFGAFCQHGQTGHCSDTRNATQ